MTEGKKGGAVLPRVELPAPEGFASMPFRRALLFVVRFSVHMTFGFAFLFNYSFL